MATLKDLRDTLLTVAGPDRILALADDYLTRFEEMGDQFILPSEHVVVKPVLEFYSHDLEGWVKFVKGVRDRLDPRSEEFRGVHEFYKTLNVRMIQRRTRKLTDAATEVALRKQMIQNNWEAKQRYAKRCIQAWKLRKDTMLNNVRAASPTGRVSVDHREELLRDFWRMIEDEVNNGEVPRA